MDTKEYSDVDIIFQGMNITIFNKFLKIKVRMHCILTFIKHM
jgi:hypothetical protein